MGFVRHKNATKRSTVPSTCAHGRLIRMVTGLDAAQRDIITKRACIACGRGPASCRLQIEGHVRAYYTLFNTHVFCNGELPLEGIGKNNVGMLDRILCLAHEKVIGNRVLFGKETAIEVSSRCVEWLRIGRMLVLVIDIS